MAEARNRIPDAFLSAIAKVESGRQIDGMVVPWPWTINAEGAGTFFATKQDAIEAVQALQAKGVRSIDVGCLQVNLQQHPDAFRSLDEAFDPFANARFAAGFLVSLFTQTGSWPLAAAAYHSQTPTLGAAYQRQVMAAWAQPDRPAVLKPGGNAQAAARPTPEAASIASGIQPGPGGSAFGRQFGTPVGEPYRQALPHATGRGLEAYRQLPVRLAFHLPGRQG